MSGAADPYLQRHRLRVELHRRRAELRWTQRQVAERLDWSESKVIRIEAGTVTISVTDLRALLTLYGVTDPERVAALVTMAKDSRRRAWWGEFRDILSPQYTKLLGYQSAATAILDYRVLLLPGMFQIEAYTRALARMATSECADQDDASRTQDRFVEARMTGQRWFHQAPNRPAMSVVLHAASIQAAVGGRDVMVQQLRALRKYASEPGITIRVLPASAPENLGMLGPFVIFELPDGGQEPAVVFLENAERDLLIKDDPAAVLKYRARHARVAELAKPATDTPQIIDDAIRALSS